MMTWLLFGAAVVGQNMDLMTWEVVVATVFASLVAHGVTAKPQAAWLARKEGTDEQVHD
jgi:NhaP-type Na+/H+ or K+/H+ antiporter